MTCGEAKSDPARSRRESQLLHCFGVPFSRIIKNFRCFWAYYALIMWAILFASLLPRRRVALIFLLVVTALAGIFLLLLVALRLSEVMTSPNAEPKSPAVIEVIFVPTLVLIAMVLVLTQAMLYILVALLLILTVVELVLTHALVHFLASVAIGLPIILTHAILLARDDDLRG
uniref:PRA1 family protein n=1 Tax=Nelumbo nucifera TaxID=4432 RepID=A0A822ZRZ0_NELNU|nr:TPA_asm: hypothetical protein HUJ06_017584 [Nelumbo nucifera]